MHDKIRKSVNYYEDGSLKTTMTHKIRFTFSAAVALSALLVVSCSNSQPAAAPVQTPAPAATDSKRNADLTAPTTPAASDTPNVPGGSRSGETAATSNLDKPDPAAPQPAAKTYRMNPKTYDIVPIDAAAHTKQVVLLTFDDGPKDLELNRSLLDTLDKHKAKAIFFLNGYRIKQHPDIVKLLDERGQTIGNHSWDHIDLKKESKEKVDRQIGDVQQAVKAITGKAPAFFRPPFGSGSEEVRAKAKEEGLLYMTWSNGSKDWEMTVKNNSPEQVVANVLEQLRPGSNILMHELPWTAEALDTLLTRLEERGYTFVDPQSIDTAMH
ncbi:MULTISPECIES: polysaccharide deacetylase family protein [unclassified Paenibacillus]|uniref:polysaccharide deacetylase family protein n=1 Tax=unclassified Paenibacillus TaxID=185978 RepID=UPI001F26FA54|nr:MULTISPECIES: polysaccharide deacetylase family protein [unclassified Paenibacillus]